MRWSSHLIAAFLAASSSVPALADAGGTFDRGSYMAIYKVFEAGGHITISYEGVGGGPTSTMTQEFDISAVTPGSVNVSDQTFFLTLFCKSGECIQQHSNDGIVPECLYGNKSSRMSRLS